MPRQRAWGYLAVAEFAAIVWSAAAIAQPTPPVADLMGALLPQVVNISVTTYVNRDSPDEQPSWPSQRHGKLQTGRSATVTRREDRWSLADWPTIAVSAEIWARTPASGRTSPADSQIGPV